MLGGRGQLDSVAMAFQERCDLGMVFFVEQRTRGVQQFTTSREEPPQRTQYALLLQRELRAWQIVQASRRLSPAEASSFSLN